MAFVVRHRRRADRLLFWGPCRLISLSICSSLSFRKRKRRRNSWTFRARVHPIVSSGRPRHWTATNVLPQSLGRTTARETIQFLSTKPSGQPIASVSLAVPVTSRSPGPIEIQQRSGAPRKRDGSNSHRLCRFQRHLLAVNETTCTLFNARWRYVFCTAMEHGLR